MTIPGFQPGFATRRALFGLDERACRLLARTWPIIAPHLPGAIDAVLAACKDMPHVGELLRVHKDLIRRLEISHFEALLGGAFDDRYIESCRNTVEQEAALGLDARMRRTAGNFV